MILFNFKQCKRDFHKLNKIIILIILIFSSCNAYACGFCLDQSLRISFPLISEIVPGILALFTLWFLSTIVIGLIFNDKIEQKSIHCPNARTLLLYIGLIVALMIFSVVFCMGSGLVPFFTFSFVWLVYLFIKIFIFLITKPTVLPEKIFICFHFCLIIIILSLIPLKSGYAYSLERMIKMLNHRAISAYCNTLFPSIIEKGESAVKPLVEILLEISDRPDNNENLINNSAYCLSKIRGESYIEKLRIKYENPCNKHGNHY